MSHYDNRIGRFLEKVMSHYELKTNGVQTELQTDRQLDRVSCTLGAPGRYFSAGLSLAHNAQGSSQLGGKSMIVHNIENLFCLRT